MEIKVGIIEDEKQIREALTILINGSEGFLCEYAFDSPDEALAQIHELHLDVVLVDIHLNGKSGIDYVSQMKRMSKNTLFIMLTSLEDTDSIFSSLKAGAVGYLTKTTQPSKILDAILEAYNGGSPMSSQIARKVVSSFNKTDNNSELLKLSQREQEIIDLLAQGFRYKEIADKLYLSTETVRTHIRNMYEKLQVNSRTEAINKIYKL